MYENDERYQLDETILFIIINVSTCLGHLYAHLQEYRCVYYCIWCSALCVAAEVLRSRCVVLCTVCKFVSSNWRFTLKINPAPIMHQDAEEKKKSITVIGIVCTIVITNPISWWYPWKLPTDPQVSAEHRTNTTALGNRTTE
jgi:hypothetical protein